MSRRLKACSILILAMLACFMSVGARLSAEPCCDPAGPFALGEAYPEHPATCETIAYWMKRAPDVHGRMSLAIKGKLAEVGTDGALAYLIMCEPSDVQVMCVTYSTNGRAPGDVVLFAGGYNRVDERRIMLDPCLASPE